MYIFTLRWILCCLASYPMTAESTLIQIIPGQEYNLERSREHPNCFLSGTTYRFLLTQLQIVTKHALALAVTRTVRGCIKPVSGNEPRIILSTPAAANSTITVKTITLLIDSFGRLCGLLSSDEPHK